MLSNSAGILLSEKEKAIVTFVPRSHEAVLRDGYDHMERCAKATAKKLGIRFYKLLGRSSNAKEQKKLDSAGRQENARKTIKLKTGHKLTGRNIILLDDIVTTGASLNACAELLLAAGARTVVAATIAATVRK
jgi:ComF family protein